MGIQDKLFHDAQRMLVTTAKTKERVKQTRSFEFADMLLNDRTT